MCVRYTRYIDMNGRDKGDVGQITRTRLSGLRAAAKSRKADVLARTFLHERAYNLTTLRQSLIASVLASQAVKLGNQRCDSATTDSNLGLPTKITRTLSPSTKLESLESLVEASPSLAIVLRRRCYHLSPTEEQANDMALRRPTAY